VIKTSDDLRPPGHDTLARRAAREDRRGMGARLQVAERTAILLVLCAALIHGLLYLFVVPPWQHYDEPTHFEYAWLIANHLKLPDGQDVDSTMRREVAASMMEHAFFQHVDLDLKPELLAAGQSVWIGFSELSHPPLYYLVLAVPLRLVRHVDVALQLYIARLVSLAFYLTSIWAAYRLLAELVPPRHPLRWMVPGMMALLPAYTDLMTSVNNDVAAIALFCLFLWGATRTIARGLTVFRVVWVVGAAALCAYAKNTASVALLFAPLVLVLACVRRPWKWPAWAALALAGLALIPLLFAWGDAALWQRKSLQRLPTSQRVAGAVWGKRAIALEVTPDEPERQLMQFLPDADVSALEGMTVTLGAWMWASQPVWANLPILYDGQWRQGQAVQVDAAPAFHAFTTTLSAEIDRISVVLYPGPKPTLEEPVVVYYDGLLLVEGERSLDAPPSCGDGSCRDGTWEGRPFTNRLRNGSAEAVWPFVRPIIDGTLGKYARRWPSEFVASLLDWQRTGHLYPAVAVHLLQGFWARFGWGRVELAPGWYWALDAMTVLGVVGALVGTTRAWRAPPSPFTRRVLGLLILSALVVWGNSFLRLHPVVEQPYIPVARYTYPAIVPTAMALLGGWQALAPRRLRRWLPWVILSILGSFDVVSLWTLWTFFYRR
jgi:hypothetical protein